MKKIQQLVAIALFIISTQVNAQVADALTILPNGNVGIGTNDPHQAKLVVDGKQSDSYKTKIFVYGYGTSSTILPNVPIENSIYASDAIISGQLNVMSDSRIKKIIGKSDRDKDLEILSKIAVTDYKMIDSIEKGNQHYKKVIAQQVEKVYPMAVSSNLTEIIPNIYQLSRVNKGWIDLETKDLVAGDKVKLVFSEETIIVTVLEIEKARIRVNCSKEGAVFVYGKEVHDFRSVDYEAIAMLNVSATQALLKRVEVLEANEAALNKTIGELKAEQLQTNQRLQRIEQFLLPRIADK
ncbi:tail fiber domain-containing protein [Flavobacterium poyangense]|uniref:tail fiber domain-containing protein n=1 Tax=Flavobacterium poyangense TaxID=2204302 RepID=UPI001421A876|nr:tail fiber domain-containing protein [Flavobacterium sp. JXAS1]